ncbi:barstar family protein [Streptosporangium canum]|uniref:barstar family protein n=1 Tax=Streptosporangium canum TaxID=324952 RepID=UPI0036839EE5
MNDVAPGRPRFDGRPRYVLVNDDDQSDVWGTCLEIRGLFVAFDDPEAEAEWKTLELVGWSPSGLLQKYRDAAGDSPQPFGNAWIRVLDYTGQRIGEFWSPSMKVIQWRPSRENPTLVDATVETVSLSSPYPAAESIWERWRHGRPASKNQWTEYRPEDREAWMSVVVGRIDTRFPQRPDAPPGGTYHLDGSNVVDEMSFYCAIGEAINGPGGYFGWNLHALDDCFNGGFGATPPFTLIWHDFEVARTHLPLENKCADPEKYVVTGQSILEAIMEILQEHVNVVMR